MKYEVYIDGIKAGFNPRQSRGQDGRWANTDYRGVHQPGFEENPTLDNLTANGLIPDDFYTHPRYYVDMNDPSSRESLRKIMYARANPNELIKAYRAVPKGVNGINTGDWVTLSKIYAKGHFEGVEGANVVSILIYPKDLRWDGDSVNEFGYFPSLKDTKKWKVEVLIKGLIYGR